MTTLYDQTMRGLQRSLHSSLIASEIDFDHGVMHVDADEKQLRCGILHQAETKENARLLIRGDVMAESRGRTEDKQLKAAYTVLHESGTFFHDVAFFQRAVTSKQLKLKPKSANIAGLQVADLLAYPCKQEILVDEGRLDDPGDVFGREICRCIETKYNRRFSDGRVRGYGQVFLG